VVPVRVVVSMLNREGVILKFAVFSLSVAPKLLIRTLKYLGRKVRMIKILTFSMNAGFRGL
jgi:hypothetical protein